MEPGAQHGSSRCAAAQCGAVTGPRLAAASALPSAHGLKLTCRLALALAAARCGSCILLAAVILLLAATAAAADLLLAAGLLSLLAAAGTHSLRILSQRLRLSRACHGRCPCLLLLRRHLLTPGARRRQAVQPCCICGPASCCWRGLRPNEWSGLVVAAGQPAPDAGMRLSCCGCPRRRSLLPLLR